MQTPPPANEPAPAPPAPPAPPEPPCTNPNPTLCPVVNATYYSYYHKTRYQDGCTFAAGNPGLTLAPAPTSGEVKPIFAPGTVFCSHHRCTSVSQMHICITDARCMQLAAWGASCSVHSLSRVVAVRHYVFCVVCAVNSN